MTIKTFKTNITINKPTRFNNIYSREVVSKAVEEFNSKETSSKGFFDDTECAMDPIRKTDIFNYEILNFKIDSRDTLVADVYLHDDFDYCGRSESDIFINLLMMIDQEKSEAKKLIDETLVTKMVNFRIIRGVLMSYQRFQEKLAKENLPQDN